MNNDNALRDIIVGLLIGLVIGIAIGCYGSRPCTRTADAPATNLVAQVVTPGVAWLGVHPVIAVPNTNGIVSVPATGCELGFREDGLLVWRLLPRIGVPSVPTNAPCIVPRTNNVITKEKHEQKKDK